MSRRHLVTALFGCLCLLVSQGNLRALVIEFTWTGMGTSNDWTDTANWYAPGYPDSYPDNTLLGGPVDVTFKDSRQRTVNYSFVDVHGLNFTGLTKAYEFSGSYDTTHIGAGGITYDPAQPVRTVIDDAFELTGSQTWNIASGTLVLQGDVYDGDNGYIITKSGAGTLELGSSYNSLYTSEFHLNDGRLVLTPSSYGDEPLGSTLLVIGPPGSANPILVAGPSSDDKSDNSKVTLGNTISLNGVLATENHTSMELTGPITLNGDTTIKAKGEKLEITGRIDETTPSRLTIDSQTVVVIDTPSNGVDGTRMNTYSGGTHVENGVLIFANLPSLPANPATNALSTSANGYLGFGDAGTNPNYSFTLQTDFLDRFNKSSTFGTIGFDSDPDNSPTNFTGNLDLTGFAASARLGSATHAILSGTITPQGSDYRFGGGGGTLEVSSVLTGAKALVVDSPAASPLTLRLTSNGNDYTGGTMVTRSAVIFSGINGITFPESTGRDVTIGTGGYVGFEYWGDQSTANLVTNSLAKITTGSSGAVGFDEYSLLVVPIDLSGFTGALYLGTATPGSEGPGLTLTGTITPAGGASAPYRFAGYKGGDLEVGSTLTGANGVHLGDPNSPATFGDPLQQKYSTVALTGDNATLSGNVTLYGGQLLVGQSNGEPGTDPTSALGTGTLVVTGMTLPAAWSGADSNPPRPQLDSTVANLIVPNDISLGTTLQIGGNGNGLRLAGQVTGSGGLNLQDNAWLSLNNDNNTFSGGVHLSGYTELDVDANHAIGTGPLSFGDCNSSEVYFGTTAPVVHGLSSKDTSDYPTLYLTQSGTTLTIDQATDGVFRGEIRSTASPDDSYRLVKTGTGTLRMDESGLYGYQGTSEPLLADAQVHVQVSQGTLVVGSNFYVESNSPAWWVHGGTLTLDKATLSNPVIVDNGGRLAGNGSFNSAITIGPGATLAPGFDGLASTGLLHIDHLELNGGGTYDWQIIDPLNSSTGFDRIDVGTVSTLVVNATALDPFTLRITSLDLTGAPGTLAGLDPSHGVYTWNVVDTLSLTGSSDFLANPASVFTLDTSQFQSGLVQGGSFALGADASHLFLTFTPVPEASTSLLLGLGLLALAAVWRRRS
jgi:MYXO-CTERM domain-containing protein